MAAAIFGVVIALLFLLVAPAPTNAAFTCGWSCSGVASSSSQSCKADAGPAQHEGGHCVSILFSEVWIASDVAPD